MRIKVTLFLAVFAVFNSLFGQSPYTFKLIRKSTFSLSQPIKKLDSATLEVTTNSNPSPIVADTSSSKIQSPKGIDFPLILSGFIAQTKLEKHLGGNDTNLQVLVFVSQKNDSFVEGKQYSVYPFLLANLPFGDSFLTKLLPFPQSTFVVGLLKNDSSDFLSLKKWLMNSAVHPITIPDSAVKLTQTVIDLKEFSMPLPCTHSEIYLEYLDSQIFNVSMDKYHYNRVEKVKTLDCISKFAKHLKQVHQKCDLNVLIHFKNRDFKISEVSEFMADLSDVGCIVKTSFND